MSTAADRAMTNDLTLDRTSTPKAVQLRTAHDYSLTSQSLERRAEDLGKLAKKTREEGYTTEARAIEADAGAILEYILPRFKEQRELPLVTEERVSAAIRNEVARHVHQFAAASDTDTKRATAGDQRDLSKLETWQGKRAQDLSSVLAGAMQRFALEVAEASYAAGLAAREMTPEALTMRSLFALRGEERPR